MPMPKTTDIGKIIEMLKKDKPGMEKDQRIAIALAISKKGKKK